MYYRKLIFAYQESGDCEHTCSQSDMIEHQTYHERGRAGSKENVSEEGFRADIERKDFKL